MVKKYIPNKGDIVFLNFNPQKGKEQSGVRPALVISPASYNKKVGLALFCPITTQIKGYPFEVILPDKLRTHGVILTDHVKNLDWQLRKIKFCEKVPQDILNEVIQRLNTLLNS